MRIILVCLFLTLPFALSAKTSTEVRATKNLELTFQTGFDYRMTPVQGSLMYFMNADNLVGLKVGIDRSRNEHQTNIALQYKYYVSNSFYVAPELFYLNTRENIDGFWGSIFAPDEFGEYKSLGAGIRIGNQWSWDYFTVGVDWVGIGQRFGTFLKETDDVTDTTYTLFNVIIGVNF